MGAQAPFGSTETTHWVLWFNLAGSKTPHSLLFTLPSPLVGIGGENWKKRCRTHRIRQKLFTKIEKKEEWKQKCDDNNIYLSIHSAITYHHSGWLAVLHLCRGNP